MSYKIEIIRTNNTLGEGPHWVPSEKALYLIDIRTGKLTKIDGQTKKITSVKPKDNTPISFILPVEGKPGQFVVAYKKEITLVHWNGKDENSNSVKLEVLATVEAGDRLNDGKADPRGRIWTGSMGKEEEGRFEDEQGKLYVIEAGKEPKEQLDKIGISNGLTWSLDHKTMYYIDSLRYRVDAMDYDVEKGTVSNRRVIFDFRKANVKGLPDGMTIDNEGMLWIACFDGAQIIRVDPGKSKLLQQIPLPALQPTSATFGGDNYDELWITSANLVADAKQKEKYPESGNVFRITGLGVHGFPNVEAKI